MEMSEHIPADAVQDNWVDRFLPAALRPYARMARYDRPIGGWLLFLPGMWGILLAAAQGAHKGFNNPGLVVWLLALFGLGAIVMRGAGCTYNDLVDRDFDSKVARTRNRPLPAGQISVFKAWLFLIAQSLIGLVILLQLDVAAIALGFCSLILIAVYPFMKRLTWWPQFFLGLTFNWGVLMGFAAIWGDLTPAALALYSAGIFWTLGYDTIYAHQDREDDALIGVKSSARLLGQRTVPVLYIFYAMMLAALGVTGVLAGLGLVYWPVLGLVGLHLLRQIQRLEIDDPAICLQIFKSNRTLGLLVGLAILAGMI